MSTVAKGNARVDSIAAQLSALGYRVAPIKASGRRGKRRRALNTVPGDLIAWAPKESRLPHILAEVGGPKKAIRKSLAELTRDPLPAGWVPLVCRCVKRRWIYHDQEARRYTSLVECLRAGSPAIREGWG